MDCPELWWMAFVIYHRQDLGGGYLDPCIGLIEKAACQLDIQIQTEEQQRQAKEEDIPGGQAQTHRAPARHMPLTHLSLQRRFDSPHRARSGSANVQSLCRSCVAGSRYRRPAPWTRCKSRSSRYVRRSAYGSAPVP